MGKHITNSPFKIKVGDKEVGDAKKVKVSGGALKEGKTHVENYFNVDTRNAGNTLFYSSTIISNFKTRSIT